MCVCECTRGVRVLIIGLTVVRILITIGHDRSGRAVAMPVCVYESENERVGQCENVSGERERDRESVCEGN
jgi:hypothetical protein